ncbi:MAG: long-chain fatty acid--CoA ligase [Bdellovibrionaceae bacterium]|nr:long-chain fatty acid--CoA ligase [Pseudobdellovibrionaceae bacterium]
MKTSLHRLYQWTLDAPHEPAQVQKLNGEWKSISSQEMMDRIFYIACYLESIGLQKGEVINILSYNRPEWVQFDLAPHLIGVMSAGLYPNSNASDIQYVLEHTEARVLVVQNKTYFEKIQGTLPSSVEKVVVIEGDASFYKGAVTYAEVIEVGQKLAQEKKLEDYLEQVDPDAPAFMIYTSGTTGDPKGVMISHANLCFAIDGVIEAWSIPVGVNKKLFSFLPLCHIAEKLQNVGYGITGRGTIYFCTQFDQLTTELGEVEPDVLLCVPRLWEKMMEGVNQKLNKAQGVKKHLAKWAFEVGYKVSAAKYSGKKLSTLDQVQYRLAEKLIFSKVKEALGLGKLEKAASGAAPLPSHVTRWFGALGIEILEDYGQSETSAVLSLTVPGIDNAGNVGRAQPGTEMKIADDGEVLTRGPHLFKGYFKNEQATRETIDSEGWLHTGDLGKINEDGFLQIIGRKKEVLKTSGGKMIAPLPIEEKIKEDPMISQVCIVGDNRKFFSAIITLNESTLADLQKENKLTQQVIEDPEVVGHVKSVVDRVNASLASYEQIKYFKLINREFSIEEGEMTPTMKMKRSVIEKNFNPLIEGIYS